MQNPSCVRIKRKGKWNFTCIRWYNIPPFLSLHSIVLNCWSKLSWAKWRANENRHHWFVSGQFSIELWQNNVSKTSSTHITYWFPFHKRNVICHTMLDEKITWNAQCTFVFQSILFAGISHYVMNLCSMFGYTVHRKCIFAIVDPI